MKSKYPISVLQLIDGFATEEFSGGAAQFGIQLARYLDKKRFQSYICGLWGYDTLSEQRWRKQLHSEGIRTSILIEDPFQLESDMLRALAYLQRIIGHIQPDIINSHFERGDLLGVISKILHPLHPHMVRTVHTEQQWQKRPWLGRLLNFSIFPWLCDTEVAISQDTKAVMDQRFAIRIIKQRKAVLIYNGISSHLLNQTVASCRESKTNNQPMRIGIIGRIEYQKAHDCFLQAGAELLKHFPVTELWIVGSGSLLDEMRKLASVLNIAHAVRFLGHRSDVSQVLQQIDILVSASRWEGFPTVILEAMAKQVPVVATDVSGSRELVRNGETGLLVPVDNPDALAQAIIWLVTHPTEAQHMAKLAWHQVHHYTLETAVLNYAQVYEQVTEHKQFN